jgi:hypothetical protein
LFRHAVGRLEILKEDLSYIKRGGNPPSREIADRHLFLFISTTGEPESRVIKIPQDGGSSVSRSPC